jgi:DNA modification methylase
MTFIEYIQNFSIDNRPTLYQEQDKIPYYINEFWTSKQRQGHSLHEISYRACFKAELPEFFIKHLSNPEDTVYDPFSGRGTTPIQANLMGRRVVANDINPLSKILTRPRLNPPSLAEINQELQEIDWNQNPPIDNRLLAFYHPQTLKHIQILKEHILNHKRCPTLDWIRMVAINRLTGHSKGFFSVYTLPPNQAVSVDRQLKINQKHNQTPPYKDVVEIILKKSKALLKNSFEASPFQATLFSKDARNIPEIADNSVDLVITSPPFLDVVKYNEDNWLRCWFAGIDLSSVNMSMHKKEEDWQEMVRQVLVELSRVVKNGGHIAFEVGEVRKGKVLLEKLVWEAAKDISSLERVAVIVNQQKFTKTSNCWGVDNNASGTNSNRIVILRKL